MTKALVLGASFAIVLPFCTASADYMTAPQWLSCSISETQTELGTDAWPAVVVRQSAREAVYAFSGGVHSLRRYDEETRSWMAVDDIYVEADDLDFVEKSGPPTAIRTDDVHIDLSTLAFRVTAQARLYDASGRRSGTLDMRGRGQCFRILLLAWPASEILRLPQAL